MTRTPISAYSKKRYARELFVGEYSDLLYLTTQQVFKWSTRMVILLREEKGNEIHEKRRDRADAEDDENDEKQYEQVTEKKVKTKATK
jgi:hypothetical protein